MCAGKCKVCDERTAAMTITRRGDGLYYANEPERMGTNGFTRLAWIRECYPVASKGHGLTDYEWADAGVRQW